MITHDGFRRKMCHLEEKNIFVSGLAYPISSVKQIKNHQSIMAFLVIVMLVGTAFVAYAGYMGIQEQVIKNPDNKDRIVTAFFLLFGFLLLASLWWLLVKFGYSDYSNCRSYWLINGKGVYVEQDDDVGIEQKFRGIGLSLQNDIKDETVPTLSEKTDRRKTTWLWLAALIFFFGVLVLGIGNYLKENIFMPLLLFGVAFIFALRFYDLKTNYDNLKWKK
ncbi:MAG: hypothetical protein WC291_11885 [Thermodesulfovibrionales bacterium]|jgi:hypothetical protein